MSIRRSTRQVRSLTTFVLAIVLGASAFATTQCPIPEQPAMSRSLEKMIAVGQIDDAMQCVLHIDRQQQETGVALSDEVRFQLAKQFTDAIHILSGGAAGSARNSDNVKASSLWRAYLDGVSEPVDKSRILLGVDRLLQHGRFDAFEQYLPSIAKAIGRSRDLLPPQTANELFSVIKRCPRWRQVQQPTSGAFKMCTKPCPEIGQDFLKSLRDELGQPIWASSPGLIRLGTNAAALEKAVVCQP